MPLLTNTVSYCLALFAITNLYAQTLTLDFSSGDDFSLIENSNVELGDLGFDHLFDIPEGLYSLSIGMSNKFLIPSVRGRLRLEHKNLNEVRKIELYTKHLTLEEGVLLVENFHEILGLQLADFYKWIEPAKEQRALRGFYGNGALGNYPEISMSVHPSFDIDIPIFIKFHFVWDNKMSARRNTSFESNTLTSIDFNVPAILASVASPGPVVEIDESQVENEIESLKLVEPTEKPQVIKEPEHENESNRLVWLLGILILLTVVGIILRSRKNAS